MIQRNLRLDTQYTILSSWYQSLEDGGNTCQNCDRVISNCVEVQNAEGAKFTVGMDCAATLSGITDTLQLSRVEASFQEAKSARAAILRFKKKYEQSIVTIETFDHANNYYKSIGGGVWKCGLPTSSATNWKQYPAEVWQPYVKPMIQDLVTA